MMLIVLMKAECLIKHDCMIISDNKVEYKPLIIQ